jgi:hypothetical protein
MISRTQEFWQAYLINFLFWTSLAQGGVIFAVVLNLSTARWGKRYAELSRYFAGFLPASLVLFVGVLLGRNHIFPWIANPIVEKEVYLNVPFLAVRGLAGLGLVAALSWAFFYKTKNAYANVHRGSSPWAVALVIAYSLIYTYLAFDLVMSLQPMWYSTLLGAYFAVSGLYLGMAGLCLVGSFGAGITADDRQRMSKLMFGFSLFWVSLLWSQYIVIWYGDKPEETEFVYRTFFQMPWKRVTLAVLTLAFILPFVGLMSRRVKLTNAVPLLASLSIVVGLMLEKYMLVAPSLSPGEFDVGWIHLWVTIAFAAVFALTYWMSARILASPNRPNLVS